MKKSRKILLVESNYDKLRAMAELFHKNGFLVFKAVTGKGALRLASEINPDVVILGRLFTDGNPLILKQLKELDLEHTKFFVFFDHNETLLLDESQIDGLLFSVDNEMLNFVSGHFAD